MFSSFFHFAFLFCTYLTFWFSSLSFFCYFHSCFPCLSFLWTVYCLFTILINFTFLFMFLSFLCFLCFFVSWCLLSVSYSDLLHLPISVTLTFILFVLALRFFLAPFDFFWLAFFTLSVFIHATLLFLFYVLFSCLNLLLLWFISSSHLCLFFSLFS